MSGRCGQRHPGQRPIACVTCQNIPGSPLLSVLAQRVEPGNEASTIYVYIGCSGKEMTVLLIYQVVHIP